MKHSPFRQIRNELDDGANIVSRDVEFALLLLLHHREKNNSN